MQDCEIIELYGMMTVGKQIVEKEGPPGPPGPAGPEGPAGVVDPNKFMSSPTNPDRTVTNIDQKYESGFYKTTSQTEGTFPSGVTVNGKDGVLEILAHSPSGQKFVIQRWQGIRVSDRERHIYTRVADGTNNYSAWKKIIWEDEIQNFISKPDNNRCANIDAMEASGFYYTDSTTNGTWPPDIGQNVSDKKNAALQVLKTRYNTIAQILHVGQIDVSNRLYIRTKWKLDSGSHWSLWKRIDESGMSKPEDNRCNNIDTEKRSGFYWTHDNSTGTWPTGFKPGADAKKDGVLEVFKRSDNYLVQRYTCIRNDAGEYYANNTYTRVWDQDAVRPARWSDWQKLYTREDTLQRSIRPIGNASDFKPAGGGYGKTSNTTLNLPDNCTWGTGLYLSENDGTVAPYLPGQSQGGMQLYTSNSGQTAGNMYVRSLEGNRWGEWNLLLNDNTGIMNTRITGNSADANNWKISGYIRTNADTNNLPLAREIVGNDKKGVLFYIRDEGAPDMIVNRGTQTWYAMEGGKHRGRIFTRPLLGTGQWGQWNELALVGEEGNVYHKNDWAADYTETDQWGDQFEHTYIVFPTVINYMNHNYKMVQEFITVRRQQGGKLPVNLKKLNSAGCEITNFQCTPKYDERGNYAIIQNQYVEHGRDYDVFQLGLANKGEVQVMITGLMRL